MPTHEFGTDRDEGTSADNNRTGGIVRTDDDDGSEGICENDAEEDTEEDGDHVEEVQEQSNSAADHDGVRTNSSNDNAETSDDQVGENDAEGTQVLPLSQSAQQVGSSQKRLSAAGRSSVRAADVDFTSESDMLPAAAIAAASPAGKRTARVSQTFLPETPLLSSGTSQQDASEEHPSVNGDVPLDDSMRTKLMRGRSVAVRRDDPNGTERSTPRKQTSAAKVNIPESTTVKQNKVKMLLAYVKHVEAQLQVRDHNPLTKPKK